MPFAMLSGLVAARAAVCENQSLRWQLACRISLPELGETRPVTDAVQHC